MKKILLIGLLTLLLVGCGMFGKETEYGYSERMVSTDCVLNCENNITMESKLCSFVEYAKENNLKECVVTRTEIYEGRIFEVMEEGR